MGSRICRFYVPGQWVSGSRLALPEEEARHAAGVLRVAEGQRVELFNGAGARARATVSEVGKRSVSVDLEEVFDEPPLCPQITLAFAVPKGKRLDWLLEKATELGVSALQPVAFDRSVAGGDLSENKRARWESHLIAAAKQCGLNWLPRLCSPMNFTECLDASAGAIRLAGAADGEPLATALSPVPQALTLIVGPEGGFTEEEKDAMSQARVPFVRLGETVLRIETACIALLAGVWACKDLLARKPES